MMFLVRDGSLNFKSKDYEEYNYDGTELCHQDTQALMTLFPQWVKPYLIGREDISESTGWYRREQVYLAHPAR